MERFQVYISADPSGLASPLSPILSPNDAPSPNLVQVTVDGNTFDADFAVYRTPRLGGSRFSDVPMFQVTVPVEAGKTYTVFVKTVDESNRVGNASNALQFVFPEHAGTPPVPPNNVPWPARAQPSITSAGFGSRIIARQLTLGNGFRGVGVRIGETHIYGRFCMTGVEDAPFFTPGLFKPETRLYFSSTQPQKSVLPFALYRYQVPNTQFPDVSGDVVQVSPMIEEIAYRRAYIAPYSQFGAVIEDPFIAMAPVGPGYQDQVCMIEMPDLRGNYNYSDCHDEDLVITQSPAPGTLVPRGDIPVTITARDRFGNQSSIQTTYSTPPLNLTSPINYEIFALDTQPVVVGAKYRYLLVRFDDNHEIDQVIPVDEIEVRSAL